MMTWNIINEKFSPNYMIILEASSVTLARCRADVLDNPSPRSWFSFSFSFSLISPRQPILHSSLFTLHSRFALRASPLMNN